MIRRWSAWLNSLPASPWICIGGIAVLCWCQFADAFGGR